MIRAKFKFFPVICYLFFVICYAIYSYSQIDLNLTLSSNQSYQTFQKLMIQLGYFNRPLSALIYSVIIIFLFTSYLLLIASLKKEKSSFRKITLFVGITIGILILAYPALSHDIFNYMFNAKMMLLYQRNPHVFVALDFPHDTWLRFMHNVHTPAPYFYGWTLLSLIPSFISFNKIIPNIINFKLFEIPFFVWQIYLLNKILGKLMPKKRLERLFLFVLNPLVLIEVFGNGHNDLIMTSLALLSLWFLIKEEKITVKNLLLSLVFLLLSASIKYVTIILLPLYLIYAFRKKIVIPNLFRDPLKREKILKQVQYDWIKDLDIGALSAIVLFLAIFTRSQDQFQSWYLVWSLSFAVFAKNSWVLKILLFFSFSMMLRYVPIIYYGDYNKFVLPAKTLITYFLPLILIALYALFKKLFESYYKTAS